MEQMQQLVGPHFEATADNWRELYDRDDIYARLYQFRRHAVLQWVDSLALGAGTGVLEVGRGPGLTAVELARRGHSVTAVDIAPAMIGMTRKLASQKGFPPVLSIGVVEWIPAPDVAIDRLAQVLAPAGHLIVTTDNQWSLNRLLDPALNPALDPFKRFLRRREQKARPGVHSVWEFEAAIENAGLQIVSRRMLGFGPFSLFKYPVMPDRFAIRLHRHFQRAADRGLPFLRGAGHLHAALARKQHGAKPQ